MRIIKFTNNRVNFLLQRPGDIVTAQEEKVKKYADRGAPLQPYMIVVGETLTTLSEFYVCVDKLLYEVNSALSALDILFKVYHVLDARYPPESEHLWMLIQRSLYKFSTKWDKEIPYIEGIVQRMRI